MVVICDDGVDFSLDPHTIWDKNRKVKALKAGALNLILGVTDVPFDWERIGFFGRSGEGEGVVQHGGESNCKRLLFDSNKDLSSDQNAVAY